MNEITDKDRNFDPIAEHFEKKVYGGLKGDIRLAVLKRDLTEVVKQLSNKLNRPLRILDVGAGMAQLSIWLANEGHQVIVNDISKNMIDLAKINGDYSNTVDSIRWVVCPYQQLDSQFDNQYFDLIMCHALLEWLAQPKDIIPYFNRWLAPHGSLSLCFYNPASFTYRNLIMGNFNLLNQPSYRADNVKSLTPNNPVEYDQVSEWLKDNGFTIKEVSGLRVFHDYAPLKRGGHTNPEAVIDMEVRYSNQTPYKWLGRYLHVLAAIQSF